MLGSGRFTSLVIVIAIHSYDVILSDGDSVIDKVFSDVLFGFFLLTLANGMV
jgi:hypothetical protein